MGKGYNNFMSKKSFHPGSSANQNKIREAEVKADLKRKHDQELADQYRKEQEVFQQRSLISKESKEKLSLSFMYDLPKELKKQDSSRAIAGPSASTSSSKPKLQWKRVKRDDDDGDKAKAANQPDVKTEPKIETNEAKHGAITTKSTIKSEKTDSGYRSKT